MDAGQRLQDLIYRIGGDTSAFDRAMRDLQNKSDQAARGMESRFDKAGRAVGASLGAMVKRFIGPLSVVGAVEGFRRVAASVAQIGEEARRAGLSTKVFQEWKHVAEQSRIPVDAMVDAFKELAIRADEFVKTGAGGAAEAFARIGLSREEVQAKLRDPSALMLEIIERTKALKNTAAGIRVFDEIFGGTGGERLVGLLDQADGKIRTMIKDARDLGLVMDEAMIKRAEEIDRKFRLLTTVVGTNLKSAILDAASALAQFIDGFREIDQRQTATLRDQLAAQERLMAGYNSPDNWFSTPKGIIDTTQKEIDRLRGELRDRTLAGMKGQLSTLGTGGVATKGDKPGYVPPDPTPDKSGGGRGSATKERADDYERLVKQVVNTTAAMVAETEVQRGLNPLVEDYGYALERARAEQELLAAAQEAGRAMTPALRLEIAKLADQYALAGVEAKQLAEQQDNVRESAEFALGATKDLLRDIVDGFIEGKSAAEVFSNALNNIGNKLLDFGFDMLFGGLKGGASKLFGGFREAGGPVQAGKAYVVGEKRPELFVPEQSGSILPYVPKVAPAGASGGGANVTYAPTYTIHAQDGDPRQIVRAIEAYDRGRLGRLAGDIPELRRRGALR